jgi:AcrR family transcriptional regulator
MEKTSIKVIDTKSKILSVANELFARNGFDGVSIRDIAQAADVNVASINYHFKNKLNLLHHIFEYTYNFIGEEITNITKDSSLKTEDVAWKMLDLFMKNGDAIVNGFRIILSDHLTPPLDKQGKDSLGPPGGEAIMEVITREVGSDVPSHAREWAVRMLTSSIFHHAAVMNSTYCKTFHEGEYWVSDEYKKFEVIQLSRSLTNYIKEHSSQWNKL